MTPARPTDRPRVTSLPGAAPGGHALRLFLGAGILALSAAAWAADAGRPIGRFEVSGNTLLPQAAVDGALGAAPAGTMNIADMQAAAQRLQDAYRAAGYGAVVVLLPEQTLDDQVLHLQVVEGKLSQVSTTGQYGFSRDNILRSVPALQMGRTPRLTDLDRELLLANTNPAKYSRVMLQPGTDTGDVEALVTVEERPMLPWRIDLDNTGTSDTGRWRLAAQYQNPNLAGRDMVLGVRAVTSPTEPSRVAVLGSTLRVPLYGAHTAIEGALLASNTRSSTNTTPAGDLRFAGDGLSAGVRAIWMLPGLSENKSQLSLGLDLRRYRTECTLGELGEAGCGPAGNNTQHALPLALGYTLYRPGAHLFNLQWVHNLPWGSAGRDSDYDANRPGATSRYQLLRLHAQVLGHLTPRWQLQWRLDGQYAPRALVAAEQVGVAGSTTVRGYEERALVGDSGFSTSLEFATRLDTLLGQPVSDAWPMLSFFVDAGGVSNHLGTACRAGHTRCHLWSAGLGASWAVDNRFFLRMDAARAGTQVQNTQRGDWKLHLSLSAQF